MMLVNTGRKPEECAGTVSFLNHINIVFNFLAYSKLMSIVHLYDRWGEENI